MYVCIACTAFVCVCVCWVCCFTPSWSHNTTQWAFILFAVLSVCPMLALLFPQFFKHYWLQSPIFSSLVLFSINTISFSNPFCLSFTSLCVCGCLFFLSSQHWHGRHCFVWGLLLCVYLCWCFCVFYHTLFFPIRLKAIDGLTSEMCGIQIERITDDDIVVAVKSEG